MSKKLLVIPVLVVVLTMLLAATGWACDPCDPCGCGCGCRVDCSPGFWKNHTGIWQDWAGDDYGWMLAALKARGNQDAFAYRQDVADTLNEAAEANDWGVHCDD